MRLKLLIGLTLAVSVFSTAANAKCAEPSATTSDLKNWFNPHPDTSDVKLAFRGTSLVFRPISLGAGSIFDPNERTVYQMGAKKETVFETKLDVRIASAIKQNNKNMILLMGKYEISKGQYAWIMGRGSLRAGLQKLRDASRDTRIHEILDQYLAKGDCKGKVTRKLSHVLSEPLSHLSYRQFNEFVAVANSQCIILRSCRQTLRTVSNNSEVPGYIRLPAEHEWEFAARGGEYFIKGDIDRSELQLDLPSDMAGEAIHEFAHVGLNPSRPIPIGSRRAKYGLYDMIGNVEELMLNAFTTENGFGAVGAYVARGGSFRQAPEEARVSKRVELNHFIRDDATDKFEVQFFPTAGLRLMIGLPIEGSLSRTGSAKLDEEFASKYVAIDKLGGAKVARNRDDATNLGTLGDKSTEIEFPVSASNPSGFLSARLGEYGSISLSVKTPVPLRLTVSDTAGAPVMETEVTEGYRAVELSRLLPGRYLFEVTKSHAKSSAASTAVSLSLSSKKAADTGVRFPAVSSLLGSPNLRVSSDSVRATGFVGPKDRTDNVPIYLAAKYDAILIKPQKPLRHDVTIRLIDNKIRNVLAVALAKDQSELLIPARGGFSGFVQVEAQKEGRLSTDYDLVLSGETSLPSVFSLKPRAPSSVLASGTSYSGYLGPKQTSAYSVFQLSDASSVRLSLSNLNADIDMSLFEESYGGLGKRIEDLAEDGDQAEVYVGDLDPGRYMVRLARKRGTISDQPIARFGFRFRRLGKATPKVLTIAEVRSKAKEDAEYVNASGSSGHYSNVTLSQQVKYFKFSATSGNTVNIIADPSGSDIDVFLETKSGNVISKSINSGAAKEEVRHTFSYSDISDGYAYLRVERTGSASSAFFSLNIRELKPAKVGRHWSDSSTHITWHKDWEVRKTDKECIARTVAKSVSPSVGWREYLPYFVAFVKPRSKLIGTSLDNLTTENNLSYENGRAIAEIYSRSSVSRRTLFMEKSWLKPLDRKNRKVIDNVTVKQFRRGTQVVVRGSTSANPSIDFSITYSLKGYTAAIKHINSMCRARILWMLGR
ncbi:MAG: SUMF1/EgtB/PvdO family nonheme iron enzyme [Pseudomonadota bacterium]